MSTNTPIAGLPSPQLTDSPNIETAVGGLASAVDSLLVPRYATTANRDAAITAPVFGSMAAVSGTGELYMYTGTAWVSARARWKFKTVAEVVTGSATIQNDDDLVASVEASSSYQYRAILFATHSTTGDIKIAWTIPAGSTHARLCYGTTSDGSGSASAAYTAVSVTNRSRGSATENSYDLTTSHNVMIEEYGVLTTAGTAGNLQLQWAQNSAAGTTTVAAGSSLQIWKVA